jgi:hypothetical protein
MRTKRLHPVRGIRMISSDKPFGPVLFIFGKFNIYDISWYGIFYKDHLAIHPGDGFTLRGIILHQDLPEFYSFFIFSSHDGKNKKKQIVYLI